MTLSSYELGERIHEGRHFDVFRAVAPDGTPVVLKLLRQLHPSPAQVTRFRHEHDMLAAVRSPRVARAIGLATDQRRWGLVQEDIGGVALSEHLAAADLDLAARLDVAIAIAEAVRDVHAQGLIHKDVNPANVVVAPDTGAIQLIDFGLATSLASERANFSNNNRLEGTLRYVAPEQTGRVAAPVDYRADLYALGATLYELFAGRPPFVSDDALELVHAHIARRPEPLTAVADVPGVLSDVVMRLLEKAVDARYKSAFGLLADLRRCRQGLVDGDIARFPLGADDANERWLLPARLYGRDAATAELVAALARTEALDAEPSPAAVLVTGPAGMGKSALVQALFEPITERRGAWIVGKFEQFRRAPFSAVVAAFRGLVTELLTQSEDRLTRLRNDLVAALGPNGRVIADVIPQIELILGPQPAVGVLNAAETTARFERVFRDFVRVFARPAHPVVLFLDDLQWADPASLRLMRGLLTDERQALLIVGAFRDDEVDATHPLTATLQGLAADGVSVPRIALEPLGEADVAALIADAASCSAEAAEPLAALVLRNTKGNPLFVHEFLATLGRDGLIRLDRDAGRWTWELDEIRARGFTQSVLDLMTQRLRGLGDATRHALQLAACVGATFDVEVVAALRDESPAQTWDHLRPAIDGGLLVTRSVLEGSCSFFHDRIQEAAWESLEEEARTAAHLAVGRRLLAGEADLFEVVVQLNRGRAGLQAPADRLELAALNLAAGRRAAASAAWQAAVDYFDVGLELLPADGWEGHHPLAMDLHRDAGRANYALPDLPRSAALIDTCLAHARTDHERAELHVVLVQQRTTSGQYVEALNAARAGLALVGYALPSDGYMDAMMASFGALQAELGDTAPADFLDRAPMTDPTAIAQCRLLSWAMAPAFYVDPLLYSVISFEAMRRIQAHGLPHDALAIFSQYGHLLGALFGDPPGGYAYTLLSRQLCDQLGNQVDKAEACFLSGNFAHGWVLPMREARPVLEEGLQAGLQSGGLQFARYCYVYFSVNDYMVGEPLPAIAQAAAEQHAFCLAHEDTIAVDCIQAVRLAVANLLGHTDGPLDFGVDGQDEASYVGQLTANQTWMVLCYWMCFKTAALAIYREHAAALEASKAAHDLIQTIPGNINIGRVAFHTGLSIAGVLPDLEGHEEAARTEQIEAIVGQLAGYAAHCEANWGHALALVQAEFARVRGEPEAIAAYETAIRLAETHAWHQDHALACELAGRYWGDQGRPELSLGYLAQARYGFEQWGAARKVALLDAEFPHLVQEEPRTSAMTSVSVTSTEASTGLLDLASVIRASQAISGELRIDRLLGRLMELVVESAGAQRGVLAVVDGEDLVVRAAAALVPDADGQEVLEADVALNISVAGYGEVAEAALNYVARTGEALVLDDARADGRFARDPYLRRARPRSVLVLPLRTTGAVMGLLYLENRLVSGAFTEARREVLNLLASQFAISYENARLYDEMEAQVAQRTEQLARKNDELGATLEDLRIAQKGLVKRNAFIRSVFGRYVDDDVVEHLLANEQALELGGERRPITVLASDLRGFTALAERLEPEAVLALLNRYFESMFAVIHEHGGTINAILGDGLFVFFGAPIPQPDAPRRAVACALGMMVAIDELKAEGGDLAELEMGIGVHSGAAVVGNLGSRDRTKYSAIGLDVNLAARIEGCTVGGQILISEATEQATRPDVQIAGSVLFSAKGVAEPLRLYEVEGLAGETTLPGRRERDAGRETAIAVDVSVVSGGVVAPATHPGTLVRLNSGGAHLRTGVTLPPLTDVRLRLFEDDGSTVAGHLYGKVLGRAGEATRIGFTSVPPAVRAFLDGQLAAG